METEPIEVIEILPKDTKQMCSCGINKTQAVLKSTLSNGRVVFICRKSCKKAFEMLGKIANES